MEPEIITLPNTSIAYLKVHQKVIRKTDRFKNLQVAVDYCNAHQIKNLIVDLTSTTSATDLRDDYKFARSIRRNLKGMNFAMIYCPSNIQVEFVIRIVSYCKKVCMKGFNSIEEAQNWLSRKQ
ncbi:MAG: hypothetical protein NXI08_06610 [bacterium]|jgi:hypothetical protein|nr:hypothetical protein [bacterium]